MLPDKLTLEIVTPEKLIFSEEVDEVVVPSEEGYLGVRPGHAPLLAHLDVGEISYRVGSTQKYLAVSGGFAEVLRESVSVLAQTCERSEDIDVERARKSRERANDRLQSKQSDVDFQRAELSLKRATSRLRIHELHAN
jgi:F-type H+-transporting ATPase subunit epsilon